MHRSTLEVTVARGILVSALVVVGSNCLVEEAGDEHPAELRAGLGVCLGGELLAAVAELAIDHMWSQATALCACIDQEVDCQACCDQIAGLSGDPTWSGPIVDCYLECNPGGSDAPECQPFAGPSSCPEDEGSGAWSSGVGASGGGGSGDSDDGSGASDPGSGASGDGSGASSSGSGASGPGSGGESVGASTSSASSSSTSGPSGGGIGFGLCYDAYGSAAWCSSLHDEYSCELYGAYGCVWLQ